MTAGGQAIAVSLSARSRGCPVHGRRLGWVQLEPDSVPKSQVIAWVEDPGTSFSFYFKHNVYLVLKTSKSMNRLLLTSKFL
jgi:hypothetical protein